MPTVTSINEIDKVLARYKPGSKVSLYLGLPSPLTSEQVAAFEKALLENRAPLAGPVEYGSTPEWPDALKLDVVARDTAGGVAALPLAVLLVLALGTVGIAGYLGVKVGSVVGGVATNLMPIALVGAGTWILISLINSRTAYAKQAAR